MIDRRYFSVTAAVVVLALGGCGSGDEPGDSEATAVGQTSAPDEAEGSTEAPAAAPSTDGCLVFAVCGSAFMEQFSEMPVPDDVLSYSAGEDLAGTAVQSVLVAGDSEAFAASYGAALDAAGLEVADIGDMNPGRFKWQVTLSNGDPVNVSIRPGQVDDSTELSLSTS